MNTLLQRFVTSRAHPVAILALCIPTVGFLGVRSFVPGVGPRAAAAAIPVTGKGEDMDAGVPAVSAADAGLLAMFAREEVGAGERLAVGISRAAPQVDLPGEVRESADLPAGLTLTSVMRTGGTLLAAMQGRLYREGDRITPQWTVVGIDDRGGTVTLRYTTGELRILKLRERQ